MGTIQITPEALKKVVALKQKENRECILRVGVSGGGCSGFSYVLEFQDAPKENDIIIHLEGIDVVCDPKSMNFLDGMEIYLDRNLIGGGLKFHNPNAAHTCGCGESFSIKDK